MREENTGHSLRGPGSKGQVKEEDQKGWEPEHVALNKCQMMFQEPLGAELERGHSSALNWD